MKKAKKKKKCGRFYFLKHDERPSSKRQHCTFAGSMKTPISRLVVDNEERGGRDQRQMIVPPISNLENRLKGNFGL